MFSFKSRTIRVLIPLAFVLTITPAYSATITTYSSLANWQAASTGDQLINFEGMVPSGGMNTYPGGIALNGVQFVGLSNSTIGVLDTNAYSWANYGTGEAGFSAYGNESVDIVLPPLITAVGLNLFTASPAATPITATILGTPFTVPTSGQPTPSFFGATSDMPISTIVLTPQSPVSFTFFDNFQWGTAQTSGSDSQTPEAGTFLLIGSGLLALAVIRRRKTHKLS